MKEVVVVVVDSEPDRFNPGKACDRSDLSGLTDLVLRLRVVVCCCLSVQSCDAKRRENEFDTQFFEHAIISTCLIFLKDASLVSAAT